MNGENRLLVTYELDEYEEEPVEVEDFMKFIDLFIETCVNVPQINQINKLEDRYM